MTLPANVRRILQGCAAGAAAVLLTAQALPVGLLFSASAGPLSPEQSYATLEFITVTQVNGVTQVSGPYPKYLAYTALATYSDNTTQDVTSQASFTATGNSYFPAIVGANTLSIHKYALSKTVTIRATYQGVSGTTTLTVN